MDTSARTDISDITFPPVSSIQAGDMAPLIYDSSHELLSFMFINRERAEAILTRLLTYSGGHFGNKFATLIELNGKVIGVEIGYSRLQLESQDLIGALNMFRASPIRLWPHIVGKVRKALDGYVPLPSSNAYYINNIAVDSSVRGSGVGRLLLEYVINKARKEGFCCVELDVTESNSNAIKFYERNGFRYVSTSGSDAIEKLYGLPRLYRMRLKFE